MATLSRLAIAATVSARIDVRRSTMPIPIDSRKKPATVEVHVTSGAGVDITWSDGHSSHYDFAYLRDECPCATCNDERIKKLAFSAAGPDRKSTRLNSSHQIISYAVFCLKKKRYCMKHTA